MKFRQVYFLEEILPDFIEFGGGKKPTKNELGEYIHSSIEGIVNFWKWFGNSKTIDSKGRPKVFYHQSQTKISEFFKTSGIKRPNYSQAKEGIYFSDDKNVTEAKYKKSDKGQLVSAYLKIENPLDIGTNDSMYFDGTEGQYSKIVVSNFKKSMVGEKEDPEPDIILYTISKKAVNWMSKKGYDGLMGADGEHKEIVVFNPAQIKSTNNSGNFSNSKYIYEMPQPINYLDNEASNIVYKAEKYYDKSNEIDSDVINGITYTLTKDKSHSGIYLIIQNEDDEFIGYIKANPFTGYVRDKDYKKLDNALQIQMTEIISDRQGEGIGTEAYKYLLSKFKYIVSDEQVTDGSINLYKKLSKSYTPKIFLKSEGIKDIDFTKLSDVELDKYGKDMYFVLERK